MKILAKLIVEFLGTFIFLSIILGIGEPIPIAIALLSAIYFGGYVSGGHYNPAVTYMMWLNNKVDDNTMGLYIISQIVGAFVAFQFYNHVLKQYKIDVLKEHFV